MSSASFLFNSYFLFHFFLHVSSFDSPANCSGHRYDSNDSNALMIAVLFYSHNVKYVPFLYFPQFICSSSFGCIVIVVSPIHFDFCFVVITLSLLGSVKYHEKMRIIYALLLCSDSKSCELKSFCCSCCFWFFFYARKWVSRSSMARHRHISIKFAYQFDLWLPNDLSLMYFFSKSSSIVLSMSFSLKCERCWRFNCLESTLVNTKRLVLRTTYAVSKWTLCIKYR